MSDSAEIVRGIMTALARVRRIHETRRTKLRDLFVARDCPARFLGELASVVGFSEDLRIHGQISPDTEWRRIIDLAPAIWAQKGRHEVYRSMVLALVGARSWIGDWHNFRAVAGPSLLPYFATAALPGGSYITNLWVEDLEEATIDRDLCMDALDLVRLHSERLDVTFALFVENWSNLFRWTTSSTGASVSDQILTIDSSAADSYVQLSEGDQTGWDHVQYTALVRVDSGGTAKFRFRDQGADHYQVELGQGAGPNNVVLRRGASSVATGTYGIPASTTPAAATGSITTVAGSLLANGETVTLDDGINPATVFEFNTGAAAAGNVLVSYTAADTADDVRDALIDAINGVDGLSEDLRITASSGGSATVTLTHDEETQRGNQAIGETVAAAGFAVSGMSGGGGPVPVLLVVETPELTTGIEVRVVIDGTVVIAYTDTSPVSPGPVWWISQGGDVIEVEWFGVLPWTPETRTLNA